MSLLRKLWMSVRAGEAAGGAWVLEQGHRGLAGWGREWVVCASMRAISGQGAGSRGHSRGWTPLRHATGLL